MFLAFWPDVFSDRGKWFDLNVVLQKRTPQHESETTLARFEVVVMLIKL